MKTGGLLRNTLLYLPAQLFAPLLQFIVTVVWTHLFDPAVYGVVAFVVAAQELTGGLGLAWWSVYLLRFRQQYADAARFAAMDARVVAGGVASQVASGPRCAWTTESKSGSRESMQRYHA